MACCGKGNKNKGNAVKNWSPQQTSLPQRTQPIPPIPTPKTEALTPITRASQTPNSTQSLFQPQKNLPPPAQPQNITAKNIDELPKCRYRDYKSKQIIGGKEITNYFCRAFDLCVRSEHCKACQKLDK